VADLSHPLAAIGLGAALGAAPGPVQVLLLGESARGGVRRGLKAMGGANGTFAVLLFALAAGVALRPPSGWLLRAIQLIGGAVLILIAVSTVIEARRGPETEGARPRLPPFVRGVLAVLFNPGALIFLATSASALLAGAIDAGGRAFAFATAAAMVLGVMVVDATTVLVGAGGSRLLSDRGRLILAIVLAAGLAAIGGWLLFQGATG
jgi:threonine/homoserine/homoserine lactone efflux protein